MTNTYKQTCPACNRQFEVPVARNSDKRKYCSENCRRRAERARVQAWRDSQPSRPRRASRRPLPDFARDAGWQLRQAVERIERIIADDRYARNSDQVAAHIDGHLKYAADTIAQVISQLHHHEEG